MSTAAENGLEQSARHLAVMLECYRAEPTEEGRERQKGHVNMGVRMMESWLAKWRKENVKLD